VYRRSIIFYLGCTLRRGGILTHARECKRRMSLLQYARHVEPPPAQGTFQVENYFRRKPLFGTGLQPT
jgi:hypothetical protein